MSRHRHPKLLPSSDGCSVDPDSDRAGPTSRGVPSVLTAPKALACQPQALTGRTAFSGWSMHASPVQDGACLSVLACTQQAVACAPACSGVKDSWFPR